MKWRSLEKDFGIGSLLSMRDQGLSNAEIAERLEVSKNTIYRLIGKQPPGIRKPRKVKKAPPPLPQQPVIPFTERLAAARTVSEPTPVVEKEPEWTDGFKVMARKIKAESAYARYIIDGMEHKVTVSSKSPQTAMEFTADELAEYIDELMNVLDLMGGDAR